MCQIYIKLRYDVEFGNLLNIFLKFIIFKTFKVIDSFVVYNLNHSRVRFIVGNVQSAGLEMEKHVQSQMLVFVNKIQHIVIKKQSVIMLVKVCPAVVQMIWKVLVLVQWVAK